MKLPMREEDLFKSVTKCFENKQFDKALLQAGKILERFPYHGETLAMKGLAMFNADETNRDEAFALVKQGLSLNIRSSICWHVFGLFHRQERNFAEACKAYRQAMECRPPNQQLLRDLPAMEIQIRDFQALVRTRYQLLELQANKESYWLGYAISVALSGRYTQAVSIIDTFMNQYLQVHADADPAGRKTDQFDRYQISEIYMFKADLLERAGEHQQAIDYLLEIQGRITDKYGLREKLVNLLLHLGRFSQAEKIVYQLISMNPENLRFHNLLLQTKQLTTPFPPAAIDELLAYYDDLAQRFPREEVPRRQVLEWLPASDPRFSARVDAYLRNKIRKGVPSLFKSLSSLFLDAEKTKVIGQLVEAYVKSLEESDFKRLPGDEVGTETPVTYLWSLAFLAQYYDLTYQPSLALHFIDKAIDHTPTILDLYIYKSKIFEHQGDYVQAAEIYDFARCLDLADRHINTRCVKRMLRINRIERANELIALFTRDGDPPQNYLYDMQCLWFELETADAYFRLNNIGRALKKYIASYTHFHDIISDQMEFHEYCARKAQLNSYLKMLYHCDAIRSHPQFLRAVSGIARCYAYLHDQKNWPHSRHCCPHLRPPNSSRRRSSPT